MNLLFLTLPAVAFVALVWLLFRNAERVRVAFVGGLVAVLSAAAAALLLEMVDSPGRWKAHTQVAWLGVEPTSGRSLTLGSSATGAVPGWPGGRSSPSITFTSLASGPIALQSWGGGGFALDSKGNVLYGTSLDQDRSITDRDSDSYTLSVKKRWFSRKWQIRVFHNQKALLDPDEGTVIASETSVVNLGGELDRTIRRMRARSDPEAGPLDRWAAQIDLLLTGSNHAYFVIAGQPGQHIQPQSSQLPVGSVLTLRWPRLRLDVRLELDSGMPRLVFLAPFRQSSPLPPEDAPAPAPTKLEIEATASPGHKAFLLPIGALPAPLAEASLVNGRFQPESGQPATDVAQAPGVTSSLDAVIEPYHFYLDTIQDVPGGWSSGAAGAGLPLLVPLVVIWLGYLCCLLPLILLLDDIIEPRTMVALLGISLCAWVVLCVRVGLAFRYASNPGDVDALAISGLTLSLGALAFLPAFVPVLALLGAAKMPEAEALGWRRLLPAANFAVFLLIPALVARMWPVLHIAAVSGGEGGFSASLSAAFAAEEPCLLFLVFWFLSCVWLWRKARRTSNKSLEDHLVNLEDALMELWARQWQLREIVLVSLAMLLLVAVARLLYWAHFLYGPSKEAIAPLFQLLGLAILLVPGKGQVQRAERVHMGRKLIVGFFLIVVPCCALPALGFADWGGMIGGLALFVPFLFVVLLGDHRPRVKWSAGALIALGVFLLLLTFSTEAVKSFPRAYTRITLAKHTSQWAQEQWLLQPAYDKTGNSLAQQFAFGDEHRWANLRMIRIGAYTGVGFGNSSPQKAGIALNTVQADSTYAFYIASEHGAWGGVFLLLLAALPLALVAWRHRRASGSSWLTELLYIIAGGFLLETLVQVWMNSMQLIPFAGRNLPLLSVYSPSDVLRWSVLFSCAVLIMVADRDPQDESAAKGWHWGGLVAVAAALIACISPIPILIKGQLADKTLTNWKPGGEIAAGAVPPVYDRDAEVRAQVDQIRSRLKFNPVTNRIEFASADDQARYRDTQLEQEIERFNGLDDSLKIVSPGGNLLSNSGGANQFIKRITSLRNVGDYMKLMDELKQEATPLQAASVPPLFRVEERSLGPGADDSAGPRSRDYEIQANPAYDAMVDLDTRLNPAGLRTIAWRNGSGDSWLLQGPGVQLTIATVAGANAPRSKVVLAPMKGVKNKVARFTASTQQTSGKSRVVLDCPNDAGWKIPFWPFNKSRDGQTVLVDIDATGSGITLSTADVKLEYQPAGGVGFRNLNGNVRLSDGARFRPRQSVCKLPDTPVFTLTHSSAGALVGAAWVGGEWDAAYDTTAHLTWLEPLARFSQSQHGSQLQFDRVTLDPKLQAAAQASVDEHGRQLQERLLAAATPLCAEHDCGAIATGSGARVPGQLERQRMEARRLFLPPRVAISIMNLDGEVLALAGWPRSSTTHEWEAVTGSDGKTRVDVHPPPQWLATQAPAAIRNRYLGDRNFDLLVAGSSSKPIWAAAALDVNPRLVRLSVRGVNPDHELFGIPIPGAPWKGTNSGDRWIDFTHYLADSNNNYQVRLNFLGLAHPNPGPNVVDVEKNSDGSEYQTDSKLETFATDPWEHAPDLSDYGFSHRTPGKLADLEDSGLALAMQAHFPINVVQEHKVRRSYDISFWSGDETDNLTATGGVEAQWGPLSSISPAATDFGFDSTSADGHLKDFSSPRSFISVLLGGSTNMWSNLDLPSSIYTAISGRPIVPHIGMLAKTVSTRDPLKPESFVPVRTGLEEMIRSGTGAPFLSDKYGGERALSRTLGPDYNFYAKTGTLETIVENKEAGDLALARIVLIIVPKGTQNSRAHKGLILSLVSEYGGMSNSESNSAVEWVSEFVSSNRDLLRDAMK